MNEIVVIERQVYQHMIRKGIKDKDAVDRIKKMSIEQMVKYLKDSEN